MYTSTELRVSVRGLVRGMFVSRLDRPWIETPFPLEGVRLASEDEIEKLQRICSYVFIDTTRGPAPELRFVEHDVSDLVSSARGREEVAALHKTEWAIQSDFDTEREVAGEVHSRLEREVEEVMSDLQNGRNLDLRKLKDGVDAMVDSILRNPAAFSWVKEMKRRNNYSYHHALGCAIWAASFGRHLGLEKDEVQQLALGGLLCDVGMTRLPIELIGKQGSLTEDEARQVRKHVEYGLEIVEGTPGMSPRIVEIVETHHERHNGSGYPKGLKGELIPIYGRIMGVVDSYNAMTCVRPHAPTRSPHSAVAELYEHRGSLFQPELVEQFIQTCGIYPTGTLVELSNGEVGVIVSVHSLKRLRPNVMLLLDKEKRPLSQFRTLDLSEVELDDKGQPLSVKGGLPVGAYNINLKDLFLD
jgi:HD-GYP domain-containing protein (c-di-GMP phosphodiesterase class II)